MQRGCCDNIVRQLCLILVRRRARPRNMTIGAILVLLAIGVGIALLVRRASGLEQSIESADERDMVEVKVYTVGDSLQVDEITLRARGIPFLYRTRGARGASYTALLVPSARAREAREVLGLSGRAV